MTRGFVYSRESDELIRETVELLRAELKVHEDKGVTEWNVLKNTIKDTASRHLFEKIKRNPIILPIIMEV